MPDRQRVMGEVHTRTPQSKKQTHIWVQAPFKIDLCFLSHLNKRVLNSSSWLLQYLRIQLQYKTPRTNYAQESHTEQQCLFTCLSSFRTTAWTAKRVEWTLIDYNSVSFLLSNVITQILQLHTGKTSGHTKGFFFRWSCIDRVTWPAYNV